MPIFEYHCFQCGSKFENLVLSKAKADEEVKCSGCGSPTVERVYSTFAAHGSTSTNGDACFGESPGMCESRGGSMPCCRN